MKKGSVTQQKSVYLTWEEIQAICAEVIKKMIGREVSVWAGSDEPHLRSWSLRLGKNSELTKVEIIRLMDTLQVDDYDRDANDFGEYPVTELTSGLAQKILDRELGMATEKSFPGDDGVCFLQTKAEPAVLHLLMEYPEVDCLPDVITIPLASPQVPRELRRLAETLVRQVNIEHANEDVMSRLDQFTLALEEKLQVKVSVSSIDGTLSMTSEK